MLVMNFLPPEKKQTIDSVGPKFLNGGDVLGWQISSWATNHRRFGVFTTPKWWSNWIVREFFPPKCLKHFRSRKYIAWYAKIDVSWEVAYSSGDSFEIPFWMLLRINFGCHLLDQWTNENQKQFGILRINQLNGHIIPNQLVFRWNLYANRRLVTWLACWPGVLFFLANPAFLHQESLPTTGFYLPQDWKSNFPTTRTKFEEAKIDGSWTLGYPTYPTRNHVQQFHILYFRAFFNFTRWGVLIMKLSVLFYRSTWFLGGFSVVSSQSRPRCFAYVDAVCNFWNLETSSEEKSCSINHPKCWKISSTV